MSTQVSICKHCLRTGHASADCPFLAENTCSHCYQRGHLVARCPNTAQCAVRGCNSKERTWLHPHTSPLTNAARHKLHGKSPAPAAATSPTTSKLYNAPTKQPCPKAEEAILKYTSDNSMLNKSKDTVITNYVSVNKTPTHVYQYEIQIEPVAAPLPGDPGRTREITQRSELKRVFEALRNLPPLKGRTDYCTDYKTLWSCTLLDPNLLSQTQVTYFKQSGAQFTVPSVNLDYKYTLAFNGTGDLVGRLDETATEPHHPAMLTRALNGMVTKYVMESHNTGQAQDTLFEAGPNSFYITAGYTPLSNSLVINRGYFSSIRPGSSSVLLNVNIMHGTFFKPVLVSDFMVDQGMHGYGSFVSLLKGRTVRLTYTRGGKDESTGINRDDEDNRKKIIAGFGMIPALQEFEAGDRKWTVKEWFETQGLPVRQPQLQCVNVGLAAGAALGGTGALWIPAEYLQLEPNQKFGKQLDPTHMDIMLRTALKPPSSNQAAIVNEGLPYLGIGNQQVQSLFNGINLSLGQQLLEIPCKILTTPLIQYQSNGKVVEPTKASWNVKEEKFRRCPGMNVKAELSFGVLDLRMNPTRGAQDLGHELLTRCKKHGVCETVPSVGSVQFARPALPRFSSDRTYLDALFDVLETAWEQMKKPKYVLVLLEAQDVNLYCAVKRFADFRAGFHTVVCTNGKLKGEGDLAPLLSNLALKFNIKTGGQNHRVVGSTKNSSFLPLLSAAGPSANGPPVMKMPGRPAPTGPMVVDSLVLGVDVVHPGGDTPSIASMVGSVDSDFANFPGSVRLQPARVEILTSTNVREMLRERVDAWKRNNNNKPLKRILYYRDGVSDQQYYDVLDKEVAVIQSEMGAIQDQPQVKITAIVVGKRHHTRFFAPNERMSYDNPRKVGGKNGNIKPGLMVDEVITLPPKNPDGFRDFFLQSHAALQGTAKAAHYIVIKNDCNFKMPLIYDLTHAFCYDYARATKGVSYCAPAYYADRLCDRAHRYLKVFLYAYDNGPGDMTDPERALRPRPQAGIDAFHTRYRNTIANHPEWASQGRSNPWSAELDDVMFWL